VEEIITYEEVINQHKDEIVGAVIEAVKEIENNPAAILSRLTGGLDEKLNELGKDLVCKALENMENEIYESDERLSEGWTSHKKNQSKTLSTIFGQIEYERRYYERKKENSDQKEYTYLVDDLFGIERHQKMGALVETRMIDLAAENAYAYSGMMAAYDTKFTDTTVMNKVHQLDDLEDKLSAKKEGNQKKAVDVLYIEADEDHISLQNGENTISRLVYVHEGYKDSAFSEDGKRRELKNVQYITGRYKESEEIWLKVLDYIYNNYHFDEIDKIFIGGDGAPWIKEGLGWIKGSKFVLDQYHLNKYIMSATAHMSDYRFRLWNALHDLNKSRVSKLFSELILEAEDEKRKERIRKARYYIYRQWEGIRNYIEDEDAINPSAEAHVSHVLADRLSSRPLGWSLIGMDRMSKLRAFKFNGGSSKDILELIEGRKKKKKKRNLIEKMTAKKPSHSLLKNKYGEKKENVPVLKRGKKNGSFQAVNYLAYN